MIRRAIDVLTIGVLVIIAVLLQVGLLAELPLPGATPDLTLVVVAAVGLARGTVPGALAGAFGGLLLDLVPPSTHPAGQWMLVLAIAGHVAGEVGRRDVGPVGRLLTVGVLGALAPLAAAAVGALVGAPLPSLAWAGELAASSAAYAVIMGAFLLPAGRWLLTRTAPPVRTAW